MGFLLPLLVGGRSVRHAAIGTKLRPIAAALLQLQPRFASSSSSADENDKSGNVVNCRPKLGLGGNNWSRMEPERFNQVVATALENGITTLEAGQEGGDQLLLNAFLQSESKPADDVLTLTMRLGYRTVTPSADSEQQSSVLQSHPGDVAVEQHPFLGPNRTMAPLDPNDAKNSFDTVDDKDNMIRILHNVSADYLRRELEQSPLVHHYQQQTVDAMKVHVVPLLHNPEAQIMALEMQGKTITDLSLDERQEFLRDRLIQAFAALEKAVADKFIARYGIVSNGLILPPEHPLYLATDTVLEANRWAMEHLQEQRWYTNLQRSHVQSNMAVVQLPINLMERTGLDVARDIHSKVRISAENTEVDEPYEPYLHKDLEIYAMRPLTCYPDRGTGTGHAFRLVDYLLPSGPHAPEPKATKEETSNDDEKKGTKSETSTNGEKKDSPPEVSDEALASTEWSNDMNGPPLVYAIALKKAMAHFDAEPILQEKMKRELTAPERETLDGCKLMQSILHDLDAELSQVRSLGAYEQDLTQKIIPLIHDTFEGYDEETADVLQSFFKSYGLAVRYAIARNTRQLLKEGGDDRKSYKYKDMPDDVKLQDYALQYLLNEEAISKVIVGASKVDQVRQLVMAASNVKVVSEQENADEETSEGAKSEKANNEPTKEG